MFCDHAQFWSMPCKALLTSMDCGFIKPRCSPVKGWGVMNTFLDTMPEYSFDLARGVMVDLLKWPLCEAASLNTL
jgi:hypothetical protein